MLILVIFFSESILTLTACCSRINAVAPTERPVVTEPVAKVRPIYGELQLSDHLQLMALQERNALASRILDSDYMALVRKALFQSQVIQVSVRKETCLVDPSDMQVVLSRRACAKPDRRDFWVHQTSKIFYTYDPLIFTAGASVHDLDLFRGVFEREVAGLRGRMVATPPSSPKVTGGFAKVTPCGHLFCSGCLESSCKTKLACPRCRGGLSGADIKFARPSQVEAAGTCLICTEKLEHARLPRFIA